MVLLGLLAAMLPSITLASETSNTDTKTNINLSLIPGFLFPSSVFAAEVVQPVSNEGVVVAEAPVKTEEEIKNEEILNKWKLKQPEKWANLPSEPFIINASAYTAAADECGKSDGKTSSGIKVHKGTIACPADFPFGAKLEIEGQGTFVCEDRGGAIKGNHIDIYMETKKEAFAFGRRNLTARVIID